MYIAFKWLLCMSLFMWGLMCCLDKSLKKSLQDSKGNSIVKSGYIYENISIPRRQNVFRNFRHKYMQRGQPDVCLFQYAIFFTATLFILVLNNKEELVCYVKALMKDVILLNTFRKILNCVQFDKICFRNLHNQLERSIRRVLIFWNHLKYLNNRCIEMMTSTHVNVMEEHEMETDILIKKLKEVHEDRNNMSQLLISAIEENKSIRVKLQLENMAKDRLLKHIEDMNKQIKENRLKYFNFQHLYLVTHQENIFLKGRIKKLTKKKNDAEENFMNLLQKVYLSKNTELRAYCSQFIVHTKENLLNSDVTTEINNFLRRSNRHILTTSNWSSGEACDNVQKKFVVTELSNDSTSLDVECVINAPKLRGLPGEKEWIGTDIGSLNDKLYNYEFDDDNDKSCTRISKNSKETISSNFVSDYSIPDKQECNVIKFENNLQSFESSSATQKFVSGSLAFKNFMRSNNSMTPSPVPSATTVIG